MKSRFTMSALMLLLVGGSAYGVGDDAVGPTLAALYPSVRSTTLFGTDRPHVFYGSPMTQGVNPQDAVAKFIAAHGGDWGAGSLDLVLDFTCDVNFGKFTTFQYRQRIDGLAVEYSLVNILVSNADNRVVYAAGTLAASPAGGFAEAAIDPNQALAAIRQMPAFKHLTQWKQPTMAVYFGEGPYVEARKVVKLEGMNPDVNSHDAWTVFVDAATGEIVSQRRDVVFEDVGGTIKGMGTPGTLPDIASNPPVALNLPNLRADLVGGGNDFTDVAGVYNIAFGGTGAVTVNSSLDNGQFGNVNPTGSSVLTATANGNTSGPVNLMFNPSPSAATTAQVNAFVNAHLSRDYIVSRAPAFTNLNLQIPINTGVSGTCNAFYSSGDNSINFFNAGGGCNNTAYSSVVAHEYGHFMVNRRGLAQGAFGEGFGDSVSIMLYDDQIIGRSFFTTGGFIRDPKNSSWTYPCGSAIHNCGEVLGSVWIRIVENFKAKYGTALGLEMARQLHVDWYLMTQGGQGSDSAHPTTAIEVLTMDDDDGNIGNGTPNYAEICAAFGAENIPCPMLNLISFNFPGGLPTQLTPNQPTNIAVNVVGVAGTPQPGTGTVSYRVNGGVFTTVGMSQSSPNMYTATIPGTSCGNKIDYFFSAMTTNGSTGTSPSSAPGTTHGATSAFGFTTFADLNFESAPAWTVTNTAITTGQWEVGVPKSGATAQAPIADFDGSGNCYLTDNRQESAFQNFDVDGGPTTLTTEAYDMSTFPSVDLSYARWFNRTTGGTNDTLVVQWSTNNGSTWTTLETVGSTTGWVQKSFSLQGLTNQVRFRFQTSDNPNDNLVEAGLDAFKLTATSCEAPCYADCDGNGALDFFDFLCFQNEFAAGCP